MSNQETTPTNSSNKKLAIAGIGTVLLVIAGVIVYAKMPKTAVKVTTNEMTNQESSDSSSAKSVLEREQDSMKKQDEQTQETSKTSTKPELVNITVEGNNYSFNPKELKVKKGDTVKLTLTSVGGFHDFVIDEFNVASKRLNDGESDTVEFVANIAGDFEYFCSVGNHRQMGMVGKLTVEE
jgi:plastocyanin